MRSGHATNAVICEVVHRTLVVPMSIVLRVDNNQALEPCRNCLDNDQACCTRLTLLQVHASTSLGEWDRNCSSLLGQSLWHRLAMLCARGESTMPDLSIHTDTAHRLYQMTRCPIPANESDQKPQRCMAELGDEQ